MSKDDLKHALITICIGAIVAFISAFFQGVLEYLKGHASELTGSGTAMIMYAIKHRA